MGAQEQKNAARLVLVDEPGFTQGMRLRLRLRATGAAMRRECAVSGRTMAQRDRVHGGRPRGSLPVETSVGAGTAFQVRVREGIVPSLREGDIVVWTTMHHRAASVAMIEHADAARCWRCLGTARSTTRSSRSGRRLSSSCVVRGCRRSRPFGVRERGARIHHRDGHRKMDPPLWIRPNQNCLEVNSYNP